MTGSLITGTTKICGIIGDPIEHTMSPVMHNSAFREMGLDYVYIPFRVKPEQLARADMNSDGVINILDVLGVVNTILNSG